MFRHKPRTEDIPDLKGFLAYLKKINPELHERYMVQIKRAFIADVLVFCCFVTAVAVALIALYTLYSTGDITPNIVAELVIFMVLFAPIIICSILGRKAHTQALRIESEIEAEYHQSGFKEH